MGTLIADQSGTRIADLCRSGSKTLVAVCIAEGLGVHAGQKRESSGTNSHRLLAGVATGANELLGGLKSGLCILAGVGVRLVCLELGVVGELNIHCMGKQDTVRKLVTRYLNLLSGNGSSLIVLKKQKIF